MAKHQIFIPKVQYDLSELPEPEKSMAQRSMDQKYMPQESIAAGKMYTMLNGAITAAFLALSGYSIPDVDIYCAETTNTMNVAEVYNRNTQSSVITAYMHGNGSLKGTRISVTGFLSPIPTISISSKIEFMDMVAMFLPIVASVATEGNYGSSEIENFCKKFAPNDSIKRNYLYGISEYIENGINNGSIMLGTFSAGNIKNISKTSLKMGTFVGGKVLCGTPHVLASTGHVTRQTNIVTVKDACNMFSGYISSLKWTPEEEMYIPSFPDDYPVPDETLKIAKRFIQTRQNKRPMVQFMWRGPTSIGKSTGVECLAAILHTPLLRMTCNPDTVTQDFLANYVPDIDGAQASLPSFEEIEFDPATAYEALTGIVNENATPQMCLEAYGKACASSNGTPHFKFVESNYVKALVRGYICEIQEASRIRKPGILTGLNEYDRPGSVIPLLNGKYEKRHPNAIVVFTDNKGYESCHPVDPSVIRRMAIVIDSDDLSKEKLFERVKYNTGCNDDNLLERMYKVFKAIVSYCEENDFMDEGSVSATEFEMWVESVMLDGVDTLNDTVRECVVNKAVLETDRQKDIMDTVVSTNLM